MKEPLKVSDHFQYPGGFLLLISFVRIILNSRFSVAGDETIHSVLGHTNSWVSPTSFREASQSRVLIMLLILSRDSRVDPCSLFACRMMRGQEETSTSQVGRRKGSIRESPTTSSLVSSMSMVEMRSFYRVPHDISLDLLDEQTRSTIGQAHNVVYFTRE